MKNCRCSIYRLLKMALKNLVRFAHNWNVGIMGLGKWDIEIRTEIALDNEVNKRVSFLQYQHSNIPLFHYSMYEA